MKKKATKNTKKKAQKAHARNKVPASKTDHLKVMSTHYRTNGKRIDYYYCHSPFQKLIETEMLARKMTVNQLATDLGLSQSTLWVWLHNRNGFPGGRSFDLEKLAPKFKAALGIDAKELASALDASRGLYASNQAPSPTDPDMREAFELAMKIIEAEKPAMLKKTRVLKILRTLFNGADSAK